MGLADRLANETTAARPKFEQWVDTLPAEDRNALHAAAQDPTISNASILRAIRAEGGAISHETLSGWRTRNGNR